MGRFQVPPFAGALIFGIRFLCFLPLRRAGITIPGRGSSAPRCAEFSCGRPRLTPPSLQLSAAEMKPPGAAPRRPEPGFLPRCSELGELGGEADPGATCCPSRLNHENVKGKNCFAIHWPPQQTSPGTESAPNTEEVDLLNFFPVPERKSVPPHPHKTKSKGQTLTTYSQRGHRHTFSCHAPGNGSEENLLWGKALQPPLNKGISNADCLHGERRRNRGGCPWLLSLEDSSPAGAAEITLSTEPKIFTTWPFIGKVCQLLL
ncbi:uncharacterized protein LOC110255245 isoform X2 [Sus scrofa]|uniref:uncharacterized protein LOC110255245 isoform X2 n=1 Tax=Sus scrofa TaxID=9823 RepID=UPI000A2B33CB|nr:uncharacterized protein LOC110255245 isoform X2 [Sus scrofa]